MPALPLSPVRVAQRKRLALVRAGALRSLEERHVFPGRAERWGLGGPEPPMF